MVIIIIIIMVCARDLSKDIPVPPKRTVAKSCSLCAGFVKGHPCAPQKNCC